MTDTDSHAFSFYNHPYSGESARDKRFYKNEEDFSSDSFGLLVRDVCRKHIRPDKKVAVYVEGKIGNDNKSIVSDAVLSRMSGNKEYAPFERNEAFIDALTKEQDYQLSGEVPEKEIREVGERLGVDYVVAVNVVFKRDDTCHMTARLINLESGAILKTVSQHRKYTDSSVLTALANNVAYRLLNKQSK